MKIILAVVLILFGALTIEVVRRIGFYNVWLHNLNHPAGWQIFADILIALGLVCYWLWHDAKKLGRQPLPWIALTVFAGSFGPLLYLLTRHLPGRTQ